MKVYSRPIFPEYRTIPTENNQVVEMVAVDDIKAWLWSNAPYRVRNRFIDEVERKACKECGASKPQQPHEPRIPRCPGCDGEVPPFMALNIHKVGQAVCPVCELELTVAKR